MDIAEFILINVFQSCIDAHAPFTSSSACDCQIDEDGYLRV